MGLTPQSPVLVVGCGRTGEAVARQLAANSATAGSGGPLFLCDLDGERSSSLANSLPAFVSSWPLRHKGHISSAGRSLLDTDLPGTGFRLDRLRGPGVVVLCHEGGLHRASTLEALSCGWSVVSSGDRLLDVAGLLTLNEEAVRAGVRVLAGAGLGPGLSCLLARHGSTLLDDVHELHVAKTGTGGPACARTHHDALRRDALDWLDGEWITRPGGSGRQLAYFPDPIGLRDCYRGALADALLLRRAFPGAKRITARMAATRRDRVTARLPMMRRPHSDGGPGAVRVELWGPREGTMDVVVLGVVGSPAELSGQVAAAATLALLADDGIFPTAGVWSLAQVTDGTPLLRVLAGWGVALGIFAGAD